MLKEKKITADIAIERVLNDTSTPLAVHEIGERLRRQGIYYSESGISARLRGKYLSELVDSNYRNGTHYKQWWLMERIGNNGEPIIEYNPEDYREDR